MDNHNNKQAARAFAAAFADSVGEALRKAIGEPWPLAVMDAPEAPTTQEHPVQFRIAVDGALRGACFAEFYASQVSELTLRIPGGSTSDPNGHAVAKVLSAAMAGLSAALLADHGEITFNVEPVEGLAFGGMFVVSLSAQADPSGAPVLLYFDGQLLATLGGPPAGSNAAEHSTSGIDPANLKLVMDVELNCTLRFGQRQLPLREVLELTSGSVIELDHMVDEPVELLLDGKLIARGEAVIVDGNYGLRVTEIPQPVASHFIR